MKSLFTKSVPMKNWYLFTGITVSLIAQSIFAICIILAIYEYGYESINLLKVVLVLTFINVVALIVSARSETMDKLRFKNIQSSQFVISLLMIASIYIYSQELLTNLYIAIVSPSLLLMMISVILEGIEVEDE